MRFSDNLPPLTPAPTGKRVQELLAVHAVNPVRAREHAADQTGSAQETQASRGGAVHEYQGTERRLACRRIRQQMVLIELRSGRDRRQHNLLQGGIADHIDEEA